MPHPKLSIIITSRNDGPEASARLRCFLTNLSEQAGLFGWNAEVVLVEWNPPPEREGLGRLVRGWGAFDCPIRVIEVPAVIHERFAPSGRLPLYQMAAKNAGVRRARGEFIVATNVDILFSNELADFLASHDLKEGIFYRVDRLDVPAGVLDLHSLEERMAFCAQRHFHAYRKEGSLHTNACGDFTLMARRHWMEVGGYAEFPLRAMKIDGLLCYAAFGAGLREKVLKDRMRVYHIEHPARPDSAPRALEERGVSVRESIRWEGWEVRVERSSHTAVGQITREQYAEWVNWMRRHKKPLIFNGSENWGLKDADLREEII